MCTDAVKNSAIHHGLRLLSLSCLRGIDCNSCSHMLVAPRVQSSDGNKSNVEEKAGYHAVLPVVWQSRLQLLSRKNLIQQNGHRTRQRKLAYSVSGVERGAGGLWLPMAARLASKARTILTISADFQITLRSIISHHKCLRSTHTRVRALSTVLSSFP